MISILEKISLAKRYNKEYIDVDEDEFKDVAHCLEDIQYYESLHNGSIRVWLVKPHYMIRKEDSSLKLIIGLVILLLFVSYKLLIAK